MQRYGVMHGSKICSRFISSTVNDLAQKVSNPSFLNSQAVGLSRCHPAAHPPRIEAVASILFVKIEDYNRCCVHHVRLHRRRCPVCCLCRGYPNICRSLPCIFSTIPLATCASAGGNNFDLELCSGLAPSNLQCQRILGRLQADFEKSCETGAYLTLCGAAIHPPCLSIHMVCRPVLTAPTLTTLVPSRPYAHLEHICAYTRTCSRHPSCGVPHAF
ncbi:hypothetical protein M405DRAFT_821326 [Rhizopogon salebrosus TDB-379]|nr:hypothetical protein M405DRAFT_821326 [Rhizopogon salebrosus TDB-379]